MKTFNTTFSSREIIDAKKWFNIPVNKQVNELTNDEFNKISFKIEDDRAHDKAYQIARTHGVECHCSICNLL